MKIFIDTELIIDGEIYPHRLPYINNIIKYVSKTGYNELYCSSENYFIIADFIYKNKFIYPTEQGINEEGFSFISFLGIRIIMIPPDKVEKYKLLK